MIMLKDALARLRRERGFTQEELARRLYITRQVVSRWECGTTEPGIDMLKIITRELDVPVIAFLDMSEHYCQSCGMMFTGPGQHGQEATAPRPMTSADGATTRAPTPTRPRWTR